jgi:hypothetical protein
MKKTKNLKIDVNFDITETNFMRNSKYPQQSISTPTSVKNFSTKIPPLHNTNNNDFRTPKNKNILEEKKQNTLKTTFTYKSKVFKENNVKPLLRETNKLSNYTPLTVQNKIIDKTRKSFEIQNKPNLMESVKKEILTSRNAKMPSIYNPISITSLLNYQYLPLDTNVIKTEYKNYEKSKSSTKANSLIKSYAANTYQGILRYHNII